MFENALAGFEHQVQAVKGAVTLFKLIDDAQALQIVLEATVVAHAVVEGLLPRVPEGRVAQVVGQGNRLDQIVVDAQCPRNRASDLGDLDGVGQTGTEQVAFVIDEYLCLVFESAKRGGMNDTVAVALELTAHLWWRLGMDAAARIAFANRVRREFRHSRFLWRRGCRTAGASA